MQLFQPLMVFLVQIVAELHQVSLLAKLGFFVGAIQTRVNRLGIDVKMIHPQRAAVQIQQYLFAVHIEALMQIRAETVVFFLQLRDGERVADHRELRAVKPVDMPRVARPFEDAAGIELQHAVAEMIPVDLVDLGKPADAEQDHTDARVPLDADVQVLEEAVLVS